MSETFRLGVGVLAGGRIADTIALAREAERLGFDTFWIAEDYYYGGAFAAAAAVAAATERIQIGIGVVNPFTRHPAVTAMEAAVVDDISDGRLLLGLGASNVRWVQQQMGIPFTHPIEATIEAVEVVRRVLAGERLEHRGRVFHLSDVALSFTPRRRSLPIWLGVKGPAALRAAGATADGVLLSVLSSVPYVRWAARQVRAGAAGADRSAPPISAYLLIHVDDDLARARDAVRGTVARYVGVHYDHPIMTTAGLTEPQTRPFREALLARRDAAALASDELVDLLAVVGPAARCRERLEELSAAGLSEPVCFQIAGIPMATTLAGAATLASG